MDRNETIRTKEGEEKEQSSNVQPDPETLHTTDPQDEMKGPLSSLVNSAKENIEEGNDDKAEADRKKDENK